MSHDATAAAIVAGETPDIDSMVEYWRATDAGARPKPETVAVLAALSATPFTHERVVGFVRYVEETYPPIDLPASDEAVNIVGTGGGPATFNISTTAAFVAAAAGAKVLKSGSPAFSSRAGSFDVLKVLGLAKAQSDEALADCLETVGIGFAPATGYAPICRRLAVASMPLEFKMIGRFVNALGPLICPYRTRGAVVGAATPVLFDIIRTVSAEFGRSVLTVRAECGIDEFVSIGPMRVAWPDDAAPSIVDPEDLGLRRGRLDALAGGDVEHNARELKAILNNEGGAQATETVALNAAAVLCMSGHAADLGEGIARTREAIRTGAAARKLADAQARASERSRRRVA
ncbi:anthranilate phosphoribosyltransferase [Stappia sp.]|uniref:anthranilate phosphoribosyltransferase n=1 Tax=Stappia sp. TaxID=1870903 RepID=UPI0032D92386